MHINCGCGVITPPSRALHMCVRVYSYKQRWLAPSSSSRPMPTSSIALPPNPAQPTDIVFLKQPFGKTEVVHRSFQKEWFSRWKRLHYDASSNLAYCFICVKALQSGKNINTDSAICLALATFYNLIIVINITLDVSTQISLR